MNLTIGMILLLLKKEFEIVTNLSINEDYPVSLVHLWNGETPKEGILYLTKEIPDNNRKNRKGLFISMGAVGKKQVKELHFPLIIVVKDKIRQSQDLESLFAALFNSLQEIIQRYSLWEKHTEQLVSTHAVFFSVLDYLENELGLISFMEDKDCHIVAMSNHYSEAAPWVKNDEKSVPNDMLNELRMDEEYINAVNHYEGFIYVYDKVYTYCYNIRLNGEYKARFMLNQTDRTPFLGGIAIVEYVGKLLTTLLEYYDTDREENVLFSPFYKTMEKLIYNLSIPVDERDLSLRMKSWEANHQYQVYLFEFIAKDTGGITEKYFERQIEIMFRDCFVLTVNGQICCVWNQTRNPGSVMIHQKLSTFLRENLCKVGVSKIFNDLAFLHQYYVQAGQALILGKKCEATQWHFYFSDMIMPYICSQAVLELSPDMLAHPSYEILKKYDKDNHTDMLYTLYIYLHFWMRVTKTSEYLYIHRTTLTFRLERIVKLTGINWDNYDEIMHIAMTFKLMKYAETIGNRKRQI